MDAASISALLVGTAGVITAIGAWANSASKNDLERLSKLLDAQDKRIEDQDHHIAHQGDEIKVLRADLVTANSKIARLQRSNRILRWTLEKNDIAIPDEARLDEGDN